MRDDALARLMTDFYAALRRGATVSSALRAAKLAAIRAGVAPNVWAGLGVYGDGAASPLRTISAPG
jgi:CHAT domain-containing protein